jgi:hypothetical protein
MIRSIKLQEGLYQANPDFCDYCDTIWGCQKPESFLSDRHVIEVGFEHGRLGVIGSENVTFAEDHHEIMKEVGKAIAFGYSRFFDLQKVESQNKRLQQDRAVERIRARVQSMESAADFENVLQVLADDIRAEGLDFLTCGIDVLDYQIAAPALAVFEETGFRYSTYAIGRDGEVTRSNYSLTSPFPDAVVDTITRFVEGEPWQRLIDGKTATAEIPISSFGRLRITTAGREAYTQDVRPPFPA